MAIWLGRAEARDVAFVDQFLPLVGDLRVAEGLRAPAEDEARAASQSQCKGNSVVGR